MAKTKKVTRSYDMKVSRPYKDQGMKCTSLSAVTYKICNIFISTAQSNSDSGYRDRCIRAWSVCLSVTLVHPAKAVGRNEMPFGRDTRVAPSNIVLDGSAGPPQEGEIWGPEPPLVAATTQPPRSVNI